MGQLCRALIFGLSFLSSLLLMFVPLNIAKRFCNKSEIFILGSVLIKRRLQITVYLGKFWKWKSVLWNRLLQRKSWSFAVLLTNLYAVSWSLISICFLNRNAEFQVECNFMHQLYNLILIRRWHSYHPIILWFLTFSNLFITICLNVVIVYFIDMKLSLLWTTSC